MLIVKRTFRRLLDRNWSSGKIGSHLELCSSYFDPLLFGTWDLPGDVSRITLSLHDRPSADRLRLRVVESDDGRGPYPLVEVGGAEWGDEKLDGVLKPYIGRRVYLQVEYHA